MNCRLAVLALLAVILLSLLFPGMSQPVERPPDIANAVEETEMKLHDDYFIRNAGQLENDDVLYYTPSGSMAFTGDSVLLYCNGPGDNYTKTSTIRLTYPGNRGNAPVGLEPMNHINHYYRGEVEEWRTGIGSYGKVAYRGMWENIDLEYLTYNGTLKYQFILRPGAEPSDIRIRVEGHYGIAVKPDEARIHTGLGTSIVDSGLDVFYQDEPWNKVKAEFAGQGDTYSFALGTWDRKRVLVIDPVLYSGFIGGPGDDSGRDISVDDDGNAYVLGQSDSLNFTTEPGVMETGNRGSKDIFVTKTNGDRIIYSAFLGGRGQDSASGIALDSKGNPLVTGTTYSDDFPTSTGCFDRTYNGVGDCFVLKLDSDGILNYSTYLGGSHDEEALSIAVDSQDRAYVTGETWSWDFPVSESGLNDRIIGDSDVFITRLNPFGDLLEFSGFLGGGGSDAGKGICLDSNEDIYITGATISPDFPATSGAVSGRDCFVTKLGQNAHSVVYSRILGGSGDEEGLDIDVDAYGNAYVTGTTDSDDFPVTQNAYDGEYNKGTDVFVTKLGEDGQDILYSTYIGGLGHERGTAIAAAGGSVYVSGTTESFNFPTTPGALDRNLGGNSDGFIVRLVNQELAYSSFLGGNGIDCAAGMCLSDRECVLITGTSDSEGLPMTGITFNEHHHGGSDAFMAELDLVAPIADAGHDIYVNESNFASFNGSASWDNAEELNYTWRFKDRAEHVNLTGISPAYFFEEPGTYRVDLTVLDMAGNSDKDVMYVRVLPYPYPVAMAGQDIWAEQGQPVVFNGSASRDSRGIVSHRWYFNDSVNDICLTGPNPRWVFTVPGNYTVMLVVSDDDYNVDADFVNVSVSDIAPPQVEIEAEDPPEAGVPVVLDASGSADNGGIVNYTWRLTQNGTNITLYGPKPTHTFWTPGDHLIHLNVTDSEGNVGTNVYLVSVPEADGSGDDNRFDAALFVISLAFLAIALTARYWPGKGADDE